MSRSNNQKNKGILGNNFTNLKDLEEVLKQKTKASNQKSLEEQNKNMKENRTAWDAVLGYISSLRLLPTLHASIF